MSNFISDTGEWLAEAQDSFRQVVGAVIPGVSHLFLPAGAWLSHTEIDDINGAIRRVLKAKRGPIAIAELLGETIRAVSAAGGERGATVGKALIVQLLSREAHESGNARIVSPLTPDAHSFLYLSEENEIQPAQSAWIACGGALIQGYVGPRAGGSFD